MQLDHTTTFSAFLNGQLVESFNAITTGDHRQIGYYGFFGIIFDEIQLSMSHVDFGIDEIQYSNAPPPVPLSAALPLFVSALGGMGLMAWRRKRKAAAA